ncbi:MAG: Ig-like domain-containing protein [Bacillota bacterium]
MKRILSLILAVSVFVSIGIFSNKVFAADENNYIYEIVNNEVSILEYIGENQIITIPGTLENTNVTNIADDFIFENVDIAYVYIPSSVNTIGSMAFNTCNNLRFVYIPQNVTSIGYNSFTNCENLMLYLEEGSAAETYAIDNGLSYSFGEPPVVSPVWSVTLNKTSLNMVTTQKYKLIATVHPDDAVSKDVTWSSSNSYYATVSAYGTVTAKNPGTVIITAKTDVGGKVANCRITIKKKYYKVTSVKLGNTYLSMYIGSSYKLHANVLPYAAANKALKWSSNNLKVAKVLSNGTVYGLKVGKARITVTTVIGGKKAYCNVYVKNPAISKKSASILTGASVYLKLYGAKKNVKWSSSNTRVASVSASGAVIGRGAGKATIFAKYNGKTYSCKVYVKKRPKIGGPSYFYHYIDSYNRIEVDFDLTNNSGKQINYITYKFEFYNRVGDRTTDEFTGLTYKTVLFIGPFNNGTRYVTTSRVYIGYVPSLNKVKISTLTLEYKDKSKEVIQYNKYSSSYD